MDRIEMKMMSSFSISVNGQRVDQALSKSRKGLGLIQFLVMADGEPLANQRLLQYLWPEDKNTNPENSLKTLVSRVRAMMNQMSPGFGNCIVSDRGSYHWENISALSLDVYEISRLLTRLSHTPAQSEESAEYCRQLMRLYTGDFMLNEDVEQNDWIMSRTAALHEGYIKAVYSYVDYLKENGDLAEALVVCRQALDVDAFDDRLHMEIINSLLHSNRHNEAMVQYKNAEQMKYRYLGVPPTKELQEFYMQSIAAAQNLDFSMENIVHDMSAEGEDRGAYVCDYMVFKDFYRLQVRNMERLNISMNLALIQVCDVTGQLRDPMEQDNLMQSLLAILKRNLRKGDLITRYSPTMIAVLLPMNKSGSGELVLDRVRREFYSKYPSNKVSFRCRITKMQPGKEKTENLE